MPVMSTGCARATWFSHRTIGATYPSVRALTIDAGLGSLGVARAQAGILSVHFPSF